MFQSSISSVLHNKDVFDTCVNEIYNRNGEPRYTFSNVFPLLFETAEPIRQNLLSFLEPMSTSFPERMVDGSSCLVAAQNICSDNLVNTTQTNLFHFIGYLIWVYEDIRDVVDDATRRNIFVFMTRFPLMSTRAVLIFQDPSKFAMSCGYALNGAVAETTKTVLDHVNYEFKLVDKFNGRSELQLTAEELAQAKTDCILDGWVAQGVILMNCSLTYGGQRWKAFTDHIVSVLSSYHRRLPFILGGLEAKQKIDHIRNPKSHFVCDLYHPAHPDKTRHDIRWDILLPFINSNMFLYQVDGRNENAIIDWSSIASINQGTALWKQNLMQFYDDIIRQLDNARMGQVIINDANGESVFEVMKEEVQAYYTIQYYSEPKRLIQLFVRPRKM